MEKIKLVSGQEFDIITNGINVSGSKLIIKFLPDTMLLDEINAVFMNTKETKTIILLSEGGEQLSVYNRFIQLDAIRQDLNAVIGSQTVDEDDAQETTEITGKLVTVELSKPDALTARVLDLESQMTDVQGALCEVYEML